MPAKLPPASQKDTGPRGISPAAVYPVMLTRLQAMPVVVVGGGQVAERKVRGLVEAGATVRLISPEATPLLQAYARQGRVQWEQRPYRPGDLSGARLVFAATNRRAVNAQVAKEAQASGILCNVVDAPAEGNFFVPAVYRDAELVIAVSTAGKSPTLARRIRDGIARWLAQQTAAPAAEKDKP